MVSCGKVGRSDDSMGSMDSCFLSFFDKGRLVSVSGQLQSKMLFWSFPGWFFVNVLDGISCSPMLLVISPLHLTHDQPTSTLTPILPVFGCGVTKYW